ncbi:hypothetical protein [Paenibacillus glucanolyticus]|uniref:hypothetical protein n=1 Tax=Paenibacillus glucanolyticus TaxID=59843 RepID=UPI00096D87F9|nr:hypothetical protein [Paenibacillus glucanolyticus]OMF70498.1 hypothetical protein BK142_23785 [Paenibacillus glucanolyticus]
MDNKIDGKVLSVESPIPKEKIGLKLEFLKQLRELNREPIFKDLMVEKIIETCKSIESDLGIKKKAIAENIVVNLSVDTSDFERKLKGLGEKAAESAERIANGFRSAAERISQS